MYVYGCKYQAEQSILIMHFMSGHHRVPFVPVLLLRSFQTKVEKAHYHVGQPTGLESWNSLLRFVIICSPSSCE